MNYYCIAALLGIAGFGSWISRINQFFFFGRTVSNEFRRSDAARAIVRRYLLFVWCSLAPAIVLLWAFRSFKPVAACLIALVVEGLLQKVAFASAHAQAGQAQQAAPCAEESVPTREVELLAAPSLPSWKAVLAPPAVAALVYASAVLWVSRAAGLIAAPNSLADKVEASGGAFLLGFSLGILICVPLALLMRLSSRSRTPLASHTQRAMIFAAWGGVAALAVCLGSAFSGLAIPHSSIKVIGILIALGALALIFWRTLKNNRFIPHAVEMHGDEHWRWGMYYVNGSDPAIFVQSRSCAGYTFNLARVQAWLLIALFVSVYASVLIASFRH